MLWPAPVYIKQKALTTCYSLPVMKFLSQLLGVGVLSGQTAVISQKTYSVAQLAQIDTVSGLPTPAQLAAALDSGSNHFNRRVPLSTNDNAMIPLVDLQVLHPPPVPKNGTHCTIELLNYAFGNSYDAPAVVSYSPPASQECGTVGKWSTIVGNLTVYS
jgi:hypothetical protein